MPTNSKELAEPSESRPHAITPRSLIQKDLIGENEEILCCCSEMSKNELSSSYTYFSCRKILKGLSKDKLPCVIEWH